MADRIFLVLPPNSLTDRAKATFKTVISPLQKAVICSTGLESTWEIHALDFGKLETTDESFECNSIFEYCGDPLAGEISTTTPPARGLELDGIGLILDRWLLSALVINSPRWPPPGTVDLELVAYDSARFGWATLDMICWREEGHNGLLGFEIGNQKIRSGTCIDSYGSRS